MAADGELRAVAGGPGVPFVRRTITRSRTEAISSTPMMAACTS
jgi:hypothetical protein